MENNQHNRYRLSRLCSHFGINCLSNDGLGFLEVYSCDNGERDAFELLDTDNPDSCSTLVSSGYIDKMLLSLDFKSQIDVEINALAESQFNEIIKMTPMRSVLSVALDLYSKTKDAEK
jgi:hypothetical protein